MVEVALTTFRGAPCIEIDAPTDINPVEDWRSEELRTSYDEIAKAFNFKRYHLDERDSRTMWIWEDSDE